MNKLTKCKLIVKEKKSWNGTFKVNLTQHVCRNKHCNADPFCNYLSCYALNILPSQVCYFLVLAEELDHSKETALL